MTFTTPLALLLLLTVPVVIYIGLPRVRFRRGRDLASLILRVLILIAADLRAGGDADRARRR